MLLLLVWKIKFGLKIELNTWRNYWILYHKTSKEALTVFWAVVKHARSSKALKKCFTVHFFHVLPLPACFTTEQSTV